MIVKPDPNPGTKMMQQNKTSAYQVIQNMCLEDLCKVTIYSE